MSNLKIKKLSIEAKILILEMLKERGFGHLGGAFSIVETLALLFGKHIDNGRGKNTKKNKDYFVLSKGHAGPAYYAVLSLLGYFPREVALTLNQNGTILPSHPDRILTPGVDCTTGSLGQGISQAAGIAYGQKLLHESRFTYCIVGDGECNEGQVWEAFQFIVNKNLNNLLVFIDDNKMQVDGRTKDISFDFDFQKILKSFGFSTFTAKADNIESIDAAIEEAKSKLTPSVIVLDSIKGQNLPTYANNVKSHHLKLSSDDYKLFDEIINDYNKQLEGYL